MSKKIEMLNNLINDIDGCYQEDQFGFGELELTQKGDVWINNAKIFADRFLKNHPLYNKINSAIFHNKGYDTFYTVLTCLKSISSDLVFMNDSMNSNSSDFISTNKSNRSLKKYDVFISHANADKEELVDSLVLELNKLGISIFYDKNSIHWGDDWKNKIYEGTSCSEFAIIIFSKNFIGREWTENELKEFLNRQNSSGQKIILPILKELSFDDFYKYYPTIANFQAICYPEYTINDIAILFANQLIKRLKGV